MALTCVTELGDLSVPELEEQLQLFLRCPVCGYDGNPTLGGGFGFLEDTAFFRPILGVQDGRLKIRTAYDGTWRTQDGRNWRIECRRLTPHFCGHEWPVPEWLFGYLECV